MKIPSAPRKEEEEPAYVLATDGTMSSIEASMVSDSLVGLQNVEQRDLMNLVDRLRRAGLSSVLQLPQIVVCGDQSSGKSSVLEAITEIPFPRKENLCTRFATEIIMRRDAESAIHCKINPNTGRADDEQLELRKFSKSIHDFTELPSVIDDATTAMGLNDRTAFSRDVLSVEICGPDLPQLLLTFWVVRWLTCPASSILPISQSDEDVELIKSLVESYISQNRTIILAVISAKNDYANQVILKNCRKFDQNGARTLGVVTKPDFLRPGSDNEKSWLDLVRNRDIYFELGWHLLKNRSDDEHHLSLAESNSRERVFFSTGNYNDLPRNVKGIDTLRQRLSELLFHHLKRELPILKEELDKMANGVRLELLHLGKIKMGINGNYEGEFFGTVNATERIDSKENSRRLRAVVQYLNVKFAARMDQKGHKYHVKDDNEEDADKPTSVCPTVAGCPEELSRKEAVKRVVRILERSRGREIPGTFNPMITSHLFWEQSEGWRAIAQDHANKVATKCKDFLLQVLEQTAPPDLRARIMNLTVTPALKAAHEAALDEIERVEQDKKRHPITYNNHFTDTLQKIQNRHSTFTGGAGYEDREYIRLDTFLSNLSNTTNKDMDKFSAEQALDTLDAYYKTERKYFIDVVAKQVIERHLVAPLADVFAPRILARYSDKQIHFLAAETTDVIHRREHLDNRGKILKEGQEAFYMAMGQEE
ncbi:interferon-induced GTP-binding protein Mx1 [Nannizzia gypsea CBS 118893]|uniref:Interferon-induced GTP-binding protein Mx1 n=1 Tax=Arthroderma gypseum (strain ATCC MYA-4604 / CBS 118893) TaxID=535722 RepID=E4UX98_ARTGP|nr:interferon-induced GTP-binding protein Mx1 [Nannizzia gypsea CBS 118893]EFR02685.1 interferon-induced GTP-binding protein Mx1 [Nannizzia gypsea CBS 118893]